MGEATLNEINRLFSAVEEINRTCGGEGYTWETEPECITGRIKKFTASGYSWAPNWTNLKQIREASKSTRVLIGEAVKRYQEKFKAKITD